MIYKYWPDAIKFSPPETFLGTYEENNFRAKSICNKATLPQADAPFSKYRGKKITKEPARDQLLYSLKFQVYLTCTESSILSPPRTSIPPPTLPPKVQPPPLPTPMSTSNIKTRKVHVIRPPYREKEGYGGREIAKKGKGKEWKWKG